MADVIFMKSDRDLQAVLRCFTTRGEFISVEIVVENRDEEASRKSFVEIYTKCYVESFEYRNASICILLSFTVNLLSTASPTQKHLTFRLSQIPIHSNCKLQDFRV